MIYYLSKNIKCTSFSRASTFTVRNGATHAITAGKWHCIKIEFKGIDYIHTYYIYKHTIKCTSDANINLLISKNSTHKIL